jgi:hypothetical protein
MAELILDARETSRIAKMTKGIFQGTSKLFKFASLAAPHGAAIAGAAHAAGTAGLGAGLISNHFKWFEFAAEVKHSFDMQQLLARARAEVESAKSGRP